MTERETTLRSNRRPRAGEPVPDDAANVLVAAPATVTAGAAAGTVLPSAATPGETAVLGITCDRTADEWFSTVREQFDPAPARLEIIEVGGTTRSAAPAARETVTAGVPRTVAVDSPADLADIGVRVSEFLRTVDGTSDDRDGPETVIYLDSLTDLIRAVELPFVFRFLHVLTALVRTAEATARYHVDPTAHDERTIATLAPLFDGRVDVDDAGSGDALGRGDGFDRGDGFGG